MLNTQLTPYGTDDPEELMDKFYQAGNEMLLALRNYVTSPTDRKRSRTWGAIEAAKMVGVSAPTFRKLQENGTAVPGIILENNDNKRNIKKIYTGSH